jgi:hypothetical protein
MTEQEQEICKSIRKHLTSYKEQADEFIIKYCELVPAVKELICNKGFTVDEAVKKAFDDGYLNWLL